MNIPHPHWWKETKFAVWGDSLERKCRLCGQYEHRVCIPLNNGKYRLSEEWVEGQRMDLSSFIRQESFIHRLDKAFNKAESKES